MLRFFGPRGGLVAVAAVVGVALFSGCGRIDGPDPSDADVPDGEGGDGSVEPCASDGECDDLIACTIDHCVAGTCDHVPCVDCCPPERECLVGFGCGLAPEPCDHDDECSDDTPCTLDRCRDGERCEHLPQNALCGDGEICLAALGCIPEPPSECTSDEDCNMGRPCLGEWYCDPEFACQFLSETICADDDECTDDRCDDEAGGCWFPPRDTDDDGHGDDACGGDDCDDGDPEVHPGADERCNGVDDDCDGVIDEECCVEGEPCETECGTEGERRCEEDGSEGPCDPPAEACNGADDDCDGAVDEDFECGPPGVRGDCDTACGTVGEAVCDEGCVWGECDPPAEVCNGSDDDCDGAVDEDFECGPPGRSADCTTSCGSRGGRRCLDGCVWDRCVPPAEVCNGIDDDCDGATDEDCCEDGEPCMTSCGSAGLTECQPDGGVVCAPPVEVCNGLDDDCDGSADEGFECSPPGLSEGCATECGSRGTRDCLPGCTWNICEPPEEICNGVDDDCDGGADEGFACRAGATRACRTICGSDGLDTCGAGCSWEGCVPPEEVCNGVDDDCDGACDDGFTCCAGSTIDCAVIGDWFAGTAVCLDTCAGWSEAACTNCGNGLIDPGEDCDGADLGGARCDTIPGSFDGGTLRCAAGCVFDTADCSECGNGRLETGEACDTDRLDGQTCVTRGFDGGDLSCDGSCAFDESECYFCGDGSVDPGEECDGGDLAGEDCLSLGYRGGGVLACTPGCRFDTSGCAGGFDPNGTYSLSPVPTYQCAWFVVMYLVDFGISSMSFIDTGATLSVDLNTSGIGCVMTGPSAEATRHIDITCTIPGGCPETYSLVGDFTDDDTWSGTFTAEYGPGDCSDCVDQSWAVTGARL